MSLSYEGFKHHIDNIEHETKMYMTYQSDLSLRSVSNSRMVLLNHYLEMRKEVARLKLIIEGE